MKGLILGKRRKRIIALCLVILQVLFQFPVKWKVEANEAEKNERITIQFQNQDQKKIPRGEGSLQLDMLVFFRGDNEGNEKDVEKNADEIEPEEKASSNLIPDIYNNGEKASDSSLRTNGRVSDSNTFQEETTKEIRQLSKEEVNKIVEKAASKNLDPSYRLILASSYKGKTNGSGKVVHEISQEYFHKNHIIFLSIRGVYKGISVERLIEYNDGKREVDRNDTGEANKILLTFKEKPVWPGKLKIDKIPEQVFQDEEPLSYSINATYNDGANPPREIEYYLEDSKKQRKRIENPQKFLISDPGLYKVFAKIPGDDNYSDLIAEADLPARKAYKGKYFTEEIQKIKLVENHKIELQINPDIDTKAILEVVKNEDLVTISNQNEIWMKNQIGDIIVNATIPSWTQGGIPYQGFTEKLIIKIQPGSQSDFQFAPSEFIKRVTVDNDVSTYEYEIPYGLTKINGNGEHSFSLKTIGQKSQGKVIYELEEGEQIAVLDKEHGILKFQDGQTGTVKVSATAPASEDSSYESKKIVAKINISYTDNSAMLEKRGIKSAKGWYQKVIYTAGRYKLSLSDSWKSSNNWVDRLEFTEDSPSTEGKEIFLMDPDTGEISSGLKPGVKLKKYNIDGTPPQLFPIVDSKNKETKIKSIREYDFYNAPLEIELKAEDAKSQVSAIHYCLKEEGKTPGEWIEMKEGTPGFEKINNSNKVIVKFPLNPQFRGRIEYYAVDNADNESIHQITDRVLVLDTIKPKGSFDFQPEGKKVNDHFYFQDKAFLTLNVEEKNFFPEDQDFTLKVYSRRNGEDKESSYRVQGNRESLTLKKNSTFISDERESLLKDNSTSFVQIMPNGEQNDLTMDFTQEGHYRLSFAYKDPSGNPLEWKNTLGLEKNGELAITVDHTDPKIFFDPSSESGQVRYFAKDVKFTTKILEENFSTNDTHLNYNFLPDTVKSSPSSLAMPVSPSTMPGRILHPRSLASTRGVQQFKNHTVTWKKEKLSDFNLYSSELNFTEDGQYEVMVDTTDLSGRKASASNFLVVDKTPPKIRLTLSNDGLANEKYFREVRKGQIEIEDANLDFSSLQVELTVKDKAGNSISIDDAAHLTNLAFWTKAGNKYTCPIEFSKDGIYHLSLKVKDLAGNENAPIEVGETKAAFDFVVDRKAPTGALKIGDWDRSKDGTLWTKLLDKISFGRFSNKKQVIRLQAEDNLSGVGMVEVLRTREKMNLADLQASASFKNVTSEVKDGYWSKEISPNETFITYVHLKDMAGNQYYLSSDGIILDQQNPEIHITLPKEEEKNGLYKKDVVVGISVTEPSPGNSYAGLKDVTYTVYRDGIETQAGSLYHFSKEEPQLNDLKKSYDDAHALTILAKDNNSNDVVLKIKAVDNAGNQTVKEERLSIDITKPRVTLSFDNNRVENEFYFKENRTALITVEERNFSQDSFKILITDPAEGKDTKLLEVERDSFQKVSGSGDSTRWESRIYFNKDGDYQLSITGEDLAGNAMEDLVYAEGTQAALDFTVDKTAPVLSVSYDNNTANHEFYYKEGRRAEISIEEKNFRSDLVDYSVLKDGGREGHGSALSSFSGGEGRGVSELHHQASISYEEDGDYQFNIRVKDLAGNEALAYPEDHFVIDRTAPSLTISDILNESANKGEVSPKISYGDRYLDQDALSLKLIGEVHGEHELSSQQGGSISIARTDALNLPMQKSMEETESPKQKQEEKEGIVYQSSAGGEEGNLSFQNFPEEPDTDDVYRLSAKIVDMAGNETTEELWFSVNRFGSTYLLSDRAKALQGTYQKEGEEILISEINADEVLSSALTLYRNEEKHTLSEGAEYQTTRSGGNGKWYRGDYLIKKDNFDKEGLYHLQISSQDKAGNLASTEQTERGAELRFGIDRTPPRILLSNVDNQGVYRGDVLDLDLSVQDNLWLEQVDATVDGTEELSWKDKSLQEAVAKDSFPLQISGEKGKRHKLLVVARDAAGNESRKEVSDFVITNNPLLRLISQKNFARNAAIATVAGLMGLSCVVNGPSLLQELKRRRLKRRR
ncbi:hypothetical protein [Oribacterium sinus]|uniref:hypothetical protein n=1 Tax=Oribacterium sinus TaxID=237576 RepID=UPI0028D8BA99|nr:hypothetical protein [Oribacterium sinus]